MAAKPKMEPEPRAAIFPAPPASCGVFRKCKFTDGENWVVVLDHPHAEGDLVRIRKRDGTTTSVCVGQALPMSQGGNPVPNCHRVAPFTAAVSRRAPAMAVPATLPPRSEWN
jgi:hypothetical protein